VVQRRVDGPGIRPRVRVSRGRRATDPGTQSIGRHRDRAVLPYGSLVCNRAAGGTGRNWPVLECGGREFALGDPFRHWLAGLFTISAARVSRTGIANGIVVTRIAISGIAAAAGIAAATGITSSGIIVTAWQRGIGGPVQTGHFVPDPSHTDQNSRGEHADQEGVLDEILTVGQITQPAKARARFRYFSLKCQF